MDRLAWFNEARFGMFIHWGAYSVAGRGEWALNRERIPFPEYVEKYVNNFQAEKFDPRAWARLAKRAGMKYMVLTTRHHDGFCLWNSRVSDFNCVRFGPKRDLLAEYAAAVRAEGLKVGFYYSAADWHHPDYPSPYARDWPEGWADEAARQRFVEYYIAQLEELLTGYGQVDLIWYDGCIPQPLDGKRANEMIYRLQPNCLINERNGEPSDFRCSEQRIVAKPGPWEACMTLCGNWGYHQGDQRWKSAADVIWMLLETSCQGGNLLLNVGPRADGTLPAENEKILGEVGAWLERNGEFLADSDRSPFSWNNSSRLTVKGNRVYVHLHSRPGEEFCLSEIKNRVLAANYVADGRPVKFVQQPDGRLFLQGLPDPLPDPLVTTIRLEVEGKPEALSPQKTFWIPG